MAGIGNNMPALANVYNYYLTSYGPQSTGRYDTHKKSELRSVYNNIVKLSKESPVFMVDRSQETRDFVVGIKENARQLHNTIASLGGGAGAEQALDNKVAYSTDENIVKANFIGSEFLSDHISETLDEDFETDGKLNADEIPDLVIEVDSIASKQVNTGYALPEEKLTLDPDAYSFDVRVHDMNYEFHFNVNEGETNQDLQYRLKRLINNAKIGLTAEVLTADDGATALRVSSNDAGAPIGSSTIFDMTEDNTSKASGALEYLGIDYVSREPSDAHYSINGEAYTSSSNSINYEGLYDLELVEASDKAVHVGIMTDVESLSSNITKLVSGYNDFLRAASEYTGSTVTNGSRLSRDLTVIARHFQETLTGVGMDVASDGTISIDEDTLMSSALDSNSGARFEGVRNFTASLLRKSDQISLDPMSYVNQKIVAYKNPFATNNFASPYITSSYSGMLFNSYC